MEVITVWRGEETTDVDGNPIQGNPKPVGSYSALVAPVTSTDTPSDSSLGVTVGYTLYVRGDPTGILDTDVIEVRGERLPVAGKPAVWQDRAGHHVGDVITVALKKGD
ncbi:MAG: hypothetical protein LKJ47_04815 [Bifidobacteriaceae bacterium]|jgi:hypothetical protein|nr:hypothetical protein [Bifidobacteriaceae bacterium]